MYKIYINETELVLNKSSRALSNTNYGKETLVAGYPGKSKFLYNYIDMLEKSSNFKRIILHSRNFKKLKTDFKSLFKIAKAGGGLVVNEFDEILFIHRRGFWDLPKGKIEYKEKKKSGAIREVVEETGISKPIIQSKLLVTNHSYRNRSNERMIKNTHWYLMEAKKQKLIPQLEEDIERAKWMSLEQFYSKPRKVYNSIEEVLEAYKKMRKEPS